jgi:Uma2 family endonuclease
MGSPAPSLIAPITARAMLEFALTRPGERNQIVVMDTVLDRPWTTGGFLAWEDQQDGKHEFDGLKVLATTGGTVAHQEIVFNLRVLLGRLLTGTSMRALQEMRLRIGTRIRYPDVLVYVGPLDQGVQTLSDAVVIFEVLSDDTAATDRVEKLIDYAKVPSLQFYIMLEQANRAAIVCKRASAGAWTMTAETDGAIVLSELKLSLPFEDIYRGLSFGS